MRTDFRLVDTEAAKRLLFHAAFLPLMLAAGRSKRDLGEG